MTITTTWAVTNLDCFPSLDGLTNVVKTVHWAVTADDGAGHSATNVGTLDVTYTPGEPFTPFANLTPDEVIGWVQTAMGPELVAAHASALADRIADQLNPPVVSPALPWSN